MSSAMAITTEVPLHAIAGGPYCAVATVSWFQAAAPAACHQKLRVSERSVAATTTELPVHAIAGSAPPCSPVDDKTPVATVSWFQGTVSVSCRQLLRLPESSVAAMTTELPV